MRMLARLSVVALAACFAVSVSHAQVASFTPDTLKQVFDANFMLIMFAVGLLVKYLPALSKVANQLIPWLNVAIYILGRLFLPAPAHASMSSGIAAIPGVVGILVGAFSNAGVTSLIYDKFIRTWLDSWLKPKQHAAETKLATQDDVKATSAK